MDDLITHGREARLIGARTTRRSRKPILGTTTAPTAWTAQQSRTRTFCRYWRPPPVRQVPQR